MRIIAVRTLWDFWEREPRAEQPLKAWVAVVRHAAWTAPTDIKRSFNSADAIGNGRVVFDLGGNKYRIVARLYFRCRIIFIRFVGTHAEYDRIDAREV